MSFDHKILVVFLLMSVGILFGSGFGFAISGDAKTNIEITRHIIGGSVFGGILGFFLGMAIIIEDKK